MRWAIGLIVIATTAAQDPQERAITYLEREVRDWKLNNGCFSCHNNGDGARALYSARVAGYRVDRAALEETTGWLRDPAGWDDNQGDPGFSDKALALVQWAATAARAGMDAATLSAEALADSQNGDGSWAGEAKGSVGSPATWGGALATAIAVDVLRMTDQERYVDEIARAEAWLQQIHPKNTPQAAALVFAFGSRDVGERGRNFLRAAQTSDSGWGPYPNAPSEIFDTALATLAFLNEPDLAAQGRQYLLERQLVSGGWPETTRPSGSQSYAQHISTTAWALMALIATDPERD